jgi:hypothetical protein
LLIAGDGFVDWDEFTTFCIYTGLITETSKPPTDGSAGGLDNYVIEYADDKNLKDTTNTSFAPLALMRHVPMTKKIIVVPDQRDTVHIMNERLGLDAHINPGRYVEDTSDKAELAKLKIMDVVYIPWKDLFCYSASDHSIVFCKELQGHSGKKQVTFNIYNRINHTFLHVKLCWSEASKLLCSVNVDNTIFGWEVDSHAPLFQISRHSQKITDFVALDNYGLFATCSLDKRIKLWSQTTRRMKGVLVGHKRGVRVLSHAQDCLLSAGFECEAKAWDLDLFEQTLTLRGHRHSISACKVMSRCDQEDELRGLTVDESGEFRLWDLFVKKGSDCTYAVTLQTFNSKDEGPAHVNFLAIPYDHEYSNGQYSNIVAGTHSLIHFRPEKSVQEFVPPACMIYSETNCCLLSAAGKNLLKYDIITGSYQNSFSNIGNSEISCLCMDGEHGRRVFVGFTNGFIYMINFATGQILSTVHAHSKAVSCLCLMKTDNGTGDFLYSGSNNGTIRMISEDGGDVAIHSTLEHATGDNAAIGHIVALEHVNVILASSIARCWGIWHRQTLKRAFLLQENDPISGIVVLRGGDRPSNPVFDYPTALEELCRQVITVAVCVSNSVRIYSVNLQNLKSVKGCLTHILRAQEGVYFSNVMILSFPQTISLNYKVTNDKTGLKDVMVAATDTGKLVLWDIKDTLEESVTQFNETFSNSINKLKVEFADTVPAVLVAADPPPTLSFMTELGSISECKHDTDDFIHLDSLDDRDDLYYDSDGSDHSHSSLFSLTSAMGTIQDNVTADLNVASSVDMTSFKMAKTMKVSEKIQSSTAKGIAEFRKLRRTETVDVEDTDEMTGGTGLRKLDPFAMWSAHKDSIVNLVKLGDSGCFATISLDGFHRVWNLQKDCLGLLALPNLTDEMKQQAEETNVEWLFLKEKIPVKPVHTTLANRFLEQIAERGKRVEKAEVVQGRSSVNSCGETKHNKKKKTSIATNDESRNNILMSLLGSYKDPPKNILPKVPSSSTALCKVSQLQQILTATDSLPAIDEKSKKQTNGLEKASKEIEELKQKLDARLSSPKKNKRNDAATSTAKRQKRSVNASSGAMHSSSSSSSIKTVFKSEKEWNNPNEFVRNPVNAFSTSSIQEGSKDGLIDDESHKILRILSKDEFRTKAFDRVVPGVMLRNVAMATSFKFPDSEVNHSEINFGQQKVSNYDIICHCVKHFKYLTDLYVFLFSRKCTRMPITSSMQKIECPVSRPT